jgi:hypothetical protein
MSRSICDLTEDIDDIHELSSKKRKRHFFNHKNKTEIQMINVGPNVNDPNDLAYLNQVAPGPGAYQPPKFITRKRRRCDVVLTLVNTTDAEAREARLMIHSLGHFNLHGIAGQLFQKAH